MIDFNTFDSEKIRYVYKDIEKGLHQAQKVRKLPFSREDIVQMLPSNLNMAEVGVWKGDFSDNLLKTIPKKLYLIDAWKNMFDSNNQTDEFDIIKKEVYDKFGSNDRVNIIEGDSQESAEHLDDSSMDFIYIDASHRFPNVYEDIKMYATKIKSGGILMGHDWLRYPKIGFAVNYSVKKFLEGTDQFLFKGITNEEKFASWIMVKK